MPPTNGPARPAATGAFPSRWMQGSNAASTRYGPASASDPSGSGRGDFRGLRREKFENLAVQSTFAWRVEQARVKTVNACVCHGVTCLVPVECEDMEALPANLGTG